MINKREEIEQAIPYISPDLSYSEWLQIGMALHSWDSEEGLVIWDEWSKNGSSYESGICEQKWNSFTSGGITIKTLFKFARDGGYEGKYEEEEEELPMVNPEELPCIALPARKISKEVCELYGVRTSVSEEDGKTPEFSFFPIKRGGKLLTWKIKNRQATSKKDKYPEIKKGITKGSKDFFGQDVAKMNGGKKLFITEGEDDCLSLYDTIVSCTPVKWKAIKPSIVAVTDGAMSLRNCCINNREFVESFEEVIIVFDNDKDGQLATKKCLQSFPKFKAATLPLGMDCNDMRKAGRDKELHNLVLWKAQHIRQGSIVEINEEFIENALKPVEWGIPSPWPSWDQKIFGIQPARIHIVAAAPKIGKSEFKNQLVSHLTFHHKLPVGVYDLEENGEDSMRNILSKYHGIDYSDPRKTYDEERLREGFWEIKDIGTEFYDRNGSRDWESVICSMEEQYHIKGIKYYAIDPLMAFTAGEDASTVNRDLDRILRDAADFVQKYKTVIFFFCHVNKKMKGQKLHEKGGRVYSNELSGSKAMEQWSHYGWGLSRDRTDECPPEDEDFTDYYLLFHRKKVSKGKLNRLYYDHETTRYLEV